MNEEQPEINLFDPPKKTLYERNIHLVDYTTGFLVGIIFSIFGFYILKVMQNKSRKRKGVFYGCILSFILILFLGVSFLCYVSYIQRTVQKNKQLDKKQRKLSLVSFDDFIKKNISGFFSLPPALSFTKSKKTRKLKSKPKTHKASKKKHKSRKTRKVRKVSKKHRHAVSKSRRKHKLKKRHI